MRRETQNILLVLLGGALLKIAFDGTYLRYVKPAQQPWLIGAGAVILVLAAVAIARDIRARRATDHDVTGGHSHASRSPWMLVLPVLAIFLIAPPALGSDSAARAGDRNVAASGRQNTTKVDFPPLPPGDVLPMRIKDMITRAGWDATESLTGRTIRLTGFIARRGDTVYLARIILNCCAADTFPVKAQLSGTGLAGLHPDQWVEVSGTVAPNTTTPANLYTPTIIVAGITLLPTPPDPYEY